MSDVKADIEHMEAFAKKLRQFNEMIRQSTSSLNGHFVQLGSTWQDQEHHKFAEEFQNTIKVLNNFLKISEPQVPFLIRKAQRLRDYINQK